MERFDINQLPVYGNLVSQQSFDSEDEYLHPTTSPPPEPTNLSSPLTGDDAAHVENLVYWGVDSPVLPPDILAFLVAAAEATHALAPVLSGPATMPNTSSMTPFPANSAPVGPVTAYADPRACTRISSLTYSPTEPQQDTSGSSASRPAGWAGTSYPGEYSFRLNSAVPTLKPSESIDHDRCWPHVDPNYPMCRCPYGPTKKPSRHWDVCPFNPEGHKMVFPCEHCGRAFPSKWNKERHVKKCPRRGS